MNEDINPMSKIKSVQEVVNSLDPIWDEADQYETDAGYPPLVKSRHLAINVLTQDRQAFEEAIVEALEGMYQDEHPIEDGVPVETYGYEAEFNSALKQAIAAVRAIYQGNK